MTDLTNDPTAVPSAPVEPTAPPEAVSEPTAANESAFAVRQSAIEQLRTSFQEIQANRQRDFAVPGWNGLWITCRALDDYSEVRDRLGPAASQPGVKIAQREISVAGELLLLSCITTYIRNPDGSRIDLDAPLGVELANTLFNTIDPQHAPRNDRQALSLLIPASAARVALAQQIQEWSSGIGAETEADLAGK